MHIHVVEDFSGGIEKTEPSQSYDGSTSTKGYSHVSQRYFYLIVKGGPETTGLTVTDVQNFFRSGVNTGSDYVFVFVDICSDRRLYDELAKKSWGQQLYEQIDQFAPLFLITDRRIQSVGVPTTLPFIASSTTRTMYKLFTITWVWKVPRPAKSLSGF